MMLRMFHNHNSLNTQTFVSTNCTFKSNGQRKLHVALNCRTLLSVLHWVVRNSYPSVVDVNIPLSLGVDVQIFLAFVVLRFLGSSILIWWESNLKRTQEKLVFLLQSNTMWLMYVINCTLSITSYITTS